MASEPKTYNADEARSFVEDMSYGLKIDEKEIQVLAFYIEVAAEEIDAMRTKLQQIVNPDPKEDDCIVMAKVEYLHASPFAQMMLGDEVRAGHLRVEFRKITKEILEMMRIVLLAIRSDFTNQKGPVEFYPIVPKNPAPDFINQNRLKELLAEWEANSRPITARELDSPPADEGDKWN